MNAHERFARLHAKSSEQSLSKGCWNWIGYRLLNGYGRFSLRGKTELAHRASWKLENGDIPHGLQVLHRCDNKACVNPAHLFLGTQKDNQQDMKSKGRGTKNYGEKAGRHKLVEADVWEIHRLHRGGLGNVEIAAKFGVQKAAIQKIVTGSRWPHIYKQVADLRVQEWPKGF